MPDSTSALINQLTNPPNPFEKFGATVDFANKLKDFQAQKAISDIYSQSIDPTTGQVDFGKFNALASQNPAAMWKLGASQQQAGQGQQALSQGTSQQLQAAQDQLGAQAGYLTQLLPKAQNGTLTADDIRGALKDMPPGLITPTALANINQQLDSGANPVNVFWGGMYANTHAREVLNQRLGPIAEVDQGTQKTFVRQPPNAPGGVSASVPIGLGPDAILAVSKFLNEPKHWTDREANPQDGTVRQWYQQMQGIENPETLFIGNIPTPGSDPSLYLPKAGGGGPVSSVTTGRAPVPQPPPSGAPTTPQPPGSSGAPAPASGQATGAPTPLVTPPPAPVTPRTTPPPATTPPPSTASVPTDVAEKSRAAYSAAQLANQNLPNVVNPFINVLSVLRANPNLQTAGQETITDVKQKLAAFGVNVPNMTAANATQELAKYLAQAAAAVPGASRSDLAALNSIAASPHLGQGPEVIQVLAAKIIGAARLNAITLDQFNSQYKDPTEAAKNSSQFLPKTTGWQSSQDSTAYALDEMTLDEIAAYYKGLSGDEKHGAKKRFLDSAKDAYRLKGITPGATVGRPAAAPTPPPAPAPTPAPAPAPAPAPTTPPPPPSGFMTPSQMYGSGAGSP